MPPTDERATRIHSTLARSGGIRVFVAIECGEGLALVPRAPSREGSSRINRASTTGTA